MDNNWIYAIIGIIILSIGEYFIIKRQIKRNKEAKLKRSKTAAFKDYNK